MDSVLTVPEKEKRVDLLNRQDFVDDLFIIADALSRNKKSACYAINGRWGVGKTFVLDMLEDQAKIEGNEGEILAKYLVFRYNCWEYDYYEEPLIAIVASMLDQIDEQVNILPADVRTRIVSALKVVGKGLAKKAVQLVSEKTGIDTGEFVNVLTDSAKLSNENIQESHEYDRYFDFKKNLRKLKETIMSLSNDQTVVFVVDELDRCLPEYTIKVLERLHHLFEGIPNVQVVLAIDVQQLEHVVRQIYGEDADAKRYLHKFIQFELTLKEGKIGDNFDEKFQEYSHHFECTSKGINAAEVEEFKTSILERMDMRSRISIINRCEILHDILIGEKTVDSSYMCLEILLVILSDYGLDTEYAHSHFSISGLFDPSRLKPTIAQPVPVGLQYLAEKYKSNQEEAYERDKIYKKIDGQNAWMNSSSVYIKINCLLGRILTAYRYILGFRDDIYEGADFHSEQDSFNEDGKSFWDMLKIIH